MKFAIFIFSAVFASQAFAAGPKTCADLEAAYQADLITETRFECNGNSSCEKLQAQQLRATVIDKSGMDPAEVAATSDQDLSDQFDPYFVRLQIGSEIFEGVNVSMGDNPFVSYFEKGTATLIEISSDDGSVSVAGKYCDAELGPVFSQTRKETMCAAVVAEVKRQKPSSKLDLVSCLAEDKSEFILDSDEAKPGVLGLYMSRNTQDLGGGYFTCTAEMVRSTNALSNIDCNVQ